MRRPDLTSLAPGLRQLAPGLLGCRKMSTVSYPAHGNQSCFELEENSFWFQHRNAVLLDTVRRFPPPGFIVDVGGGNGYVTRALEKAGWQTVLLEPSSDGVRRAQSRGVDWVARATWEEAGFLADVVPAVALFDVLEHISDDRALLASVGQTLTPGGRLYVTVPAQAWLWSDDDARAGHFRRYSSRMLGERLGAVGLSVEWLTSFFSCLPLPIFLRHKLLRMFGKARDLETQFRNSHRPSALARAAVGAYCRLERMLLARGGSIPFGSSLLAVARKV